VVPPQGVNNAVALQPGVIMNKALSNNVIWLLVAGYFLWVLADSFFHPASTAVSATMNVFFLIAIATLHGLRRYSLKEFLIFFVITFIVSNFYENLSILTGFPFGHYHYTDALGPKLFLVPLLIAPASERCLGTGRALWYDRSRVLESSCGRIRDCGSYLGATRTDRWECRDHRRNRPAMAGHADLPKHGIDSDLHDGICGASERSSGR
jgi:hypothetical protein